MRIITYLLLLLTPFSNLADVFLGKVVSEEDNPLSGVIITDVNRKPVTVTDDAGEFIIVSDNKILKIFLNHVGYLPTSTVLRADRNRNKVIKMAVDPTSLDEVVVTATRTPKTLKDAPVITMLINSDDIKHADATNIQDLLTEELPGLEFGYAMTQETTLNMSGFGGNAVLFLIDGERLAGETMDNVDYNRLSLENVGRVEIVKGASSALYGANAVGGVINLISRENREPWHVSLNSRYGNFADDFRAGGVADFNSKHWNSSTTLQYHSSESVQLTPWSDVKSKIHRIYGGNSWNVKERLTYRVNDNLRFIARGGYFDRTSRRDFYSDRYVDYSGGIKGEYEIDGTNSLEVSYSYDQFNKSRYIGGVLTDVHDYSNRQHYFHGLYTKFWGLNGLTVGADYMHDFLSTYQFVDKGYHKQTSFDIFAQFEYNPLKWLNVTGSLRDDYYSASKKNAVTSRVALMFKPEPLIVRLSYAGGFRAPSLKEMFMDYDMVGIQMIYGNPSLQPERSHNVNVSLEKSGKITRTFLEGTYSISGIGYFNYYENRIVAAEVPDYDPLNPAIMYVNENGVKVSGIDITARYFSKWGWGVKLSYNYYHTSGRNIETEFFQPRPHSATWKIDYEKQVCSFWRAYVSLSGRFYGNPETGLPSQSAYNIWKFTLQQTLWRGINVNFVIDNLFNYKPQYYYWNSPLTKGISVNIGVALSLDDLF